jgi:hypothetical protein
MAQMHAAPPLDTEYGPRSDRDAGRGWAVFAAVMFVTIAANNAVFGISALVNDDYFASDELLFGDLAMWGGLALTFALAQLITGVLLFTRQPSGVVLGIMLAVLHATVALITIGAYPLWNVIANVIDGLIIYGLSVHGAEWS